jgi:hypothetical protein
MRPYLEKYHHRTKKKKKEGKKEGRVLGNFSFFHCYFCFQSKIIPGESDIFFKIYKLYTLGLFSILFIKEKYIKINMTFLLESYHFSGHRHDERIQNSLNHAVV